MRPNKALKINKVPVKIGGGDKHNHLLIPNDKKSSKLHIGSLPASSKEESLHEYFSKFGPVTEVVISRNRKGFCRGHGSVTMEKVSDSMKILEIGENNHQIQGRFIFIKAFMEGSELEQSQELISKRRIYLSNISLKISDEQLSQCLKIFGPLENAYRVVSLSGKKRKYGFASFSTEEGALRCLSAGKINILSSHVFCTVYQAKGLKKKAPPVLNK